MSQKATFKFTFPITKSEQRDDGRYLIGYASGPEIDTDGERMHPEAIEKFSDQINASNGADYPLTYRDAHAPDGVLRDLGVITKAWVNEHFHLGIEVKLDDDNPAADYLYKQVQKGKQYGMSVHGTVTDWSDDFVEDLGKTVRTFKNVILDEISNTTRPAWYPSFGTVLAKSVTDASDDAAGDNPVKTQKNGEPLDGDVKDAPQGDDAADSKTGEGVEDTDEAAVDETVDDAKDSQKSEDETDDDTGVEKAGRKVSAATAAQFKGLYDQMTTLLTDVGVLESDSSAEKSASEAGDTTTEKSDASTDASEPTLADVVAALEKANERIAELESAPRTQLPPKLTDVEKSAISTIEEVLSKAEPGDRLRTAFALHTKGR
jgi:hypothetical protein